MSIAASLAFAARYVSRHRWQSLLLALAIGLVLALPAAVRVFAKTLEREMRARAVATPQVLGAKGSALDLMLAALHFRRQPLEMIKLGLTDSITESGMATAIPLDVRFHSQGSPIVGTTLDYFSFRGLQVRDGHLFRRLGDCVIGGRIARDRGLKSGNFLFSTSEQVFDIAGEYPLKMRIAGVLAESGTPDDHAIFCDLKTTWLIEGRAHGHDDLTQAAASDILKKESGNVVGSAAVKMFKEVTDKNLNSFHFHGELAEYPITAAILVPVDARAETILAGRYLGAKDGLQLIRPVDELGALLSTLFQIEGAAIAALLLVGIAALAVTVIVFALTFKMRRQEFSTLEDIGVSAATLRLVKLFEMALIVIAGTLIAASLVWLVSAASPSLITWGLR